MGIYTLVTRPQSIVYYENDSYREKLFSGFIDGDPDDAEGTTLAGSGSGSAIFSGFDFSSVPQNAVIKSMSATVKCSSDNKTYVKKLSCQPCYDVTGINSFEDFGVSEKIFCEKQVLKLSSPVTVDFPEHIRSSELLPNILSGGLMMRMFLSVATGSILNSMILHFYDFFVTVEYEIPSHTVLLSREPAEGGTVTGSGNYEYGSVITVSATANEGFSFTGWSDGSNENPRQLTVTGSIALKALFSEIQTGNVYIGAKRCSVYVGTKKAFVYAGTKKLS